MDFDLLNHLNFDKALCERVLSLAEKEEDSVLKCAERVFNRNVSCLKGNLNIKDLNKFHYIFKMNNES